MSDNYDCPVGECDYTGGSIAAVRAHANSLADNHPMWGTMKDDVVAQQSSDDTSDDTSNNDQQEPATDQRETSENTSNDTSDSTSDTSTETMPTNDEYQEQHQDDSSNDTSDSTSDKGSVNIPSLPMNPTTLLILFVVAISFYLMYRTVGSSNTDPDKTAGVDEYPEDSAFDSDGDLQGGLIG